MERFNWKIEKAALRATLNACKRQGMSAEETKAALETQFAASCNVCILCNLGHVTCDHKKCYLESALETYCKVAER